MAKQPGSSDDIVTDGSGIVQNRSFPFEFSAEVPAETDETEPLVVSREIPYDGHITSVIIGWPDGTGGGVGVSFGTATGEDFVPRNAEDEYIAANDFTHPFKVSTYVSEDETLEAKYVNHDSSNSHFVNVFAEIEEM